MIHYHYKSKYNQSRMSSPAEIHLMPCSTLKSPWYYCWLLTAQVSHMAGWSEAFPIANIGTCSLLSPNQLHIAIAL